MEAQRQLVAAQTAAEGRSAELASIAQRLQEAEAARSAATAELSAMQARQQFNSISTAKVAL